MHNVGDEKSKSLSKSITFFISICNSSYLGGWNIFIQYVFVPKIFEINKVNGIFENAIGIFRV